MARIDAEVRVTTSVLDRLLDYEPQISTEAPKSRSTSLRDLRASVRRDLEWLLNTRSTYSFDDDGPEEAKRSVAYYGLPDFTGISVQNQAEQRRLTKAIETAIRFFEPRFLDLRVIMEPFDTVDRQLKFRIEARLDVDPVPEPIAFDTILQVGSGEFVLSEK